VAETHDLVIRGGTVFDGSGEPGVEADVAVTAGRIAEVGRVAGPGREEIDARGLIVTPGFVDIHTHYDGQAIWGERLSPSSWHGVTTVLMGNCGVGFAPCRPDDHDLLIRLMEGVEDIPGPVLTQGLDWSWESFPEFLRALQARPHDIDFAAQVPHAAVRVYVMGERGANREPASPADIAAMAAIAGDGIRAGGLGFSTSRTLNHRASDGRPTPTLTAAEDELTGVALALEGAGRGVLQVVSDFLEPDREMAMLRRIAEASRRPLSISLVQNERAPAAWRRILDLIERASAEGVAMRAQVCGRPIGLVLGLRLTMNPFSTHPSHREIAHLPIEERIARLRDPDLRARLLAEEPASDSPFTRGVLANFAKMFPLGDPPDYEPTPDKSLAALSRETGKRSTELALDLMLERAGRGLLYFPFLNYAEGSLDPSLEMMRHPDTVLGLGDGGAHVGMISDGSFPTTMLTHWTRDRSRGPKLPIEWVVKAQCRDTAHAVGLDDRGYVKRGYKADLNVIDYDRLTLHAPDVAYDLPAGGRRLVQRADGYVATVVSGAIVYRDGEPTGALPGRLVRGPQPPLGFTPA
jgi:N-acyl-D-aspartate/D-glutamate deacylase